MGEPINLAYQKHLKDRYDGSKLGMKDKLHHWRTADYDDLFNTHDSGKKGYLNSKEQRHMFTESGITMMTTFDIVKCDKYLTKQAMCEKIEHMMPQDVVARRAKSVFEHADRAESPDGRLTGFIAQETLEWHLNEHGIDEESIIIFISPFIRNDAKIEYNKVLDALFPQDLPPDIDEAPTPTGSGKNRTPS